MPTINDIKPRAFRSIPIKVMTEVKISFTGGEVKLSDLPKVIEWQDGKCYSVEVI